MKSKLFIVFILLLGFWLRTPIMKWGLPNSEHFCLFDSDEYTAILLLERMEPKKLNFFPLFCLTNKIFPDPVFHYYTIGAAELVASKLGLVKITTDKGYYLNHPDKYARLFIVGRYLSLIMGLLTVILVYILGRIAYGEEAGLLAAFFLSVIPLHVVYSAVLNVAEPVTMWLTLTVCFSVMLYKTKQMKWYLLAGASAGLAMGTKYTAFPVMLTVVVSHLLAEKRLAPNRNLALFFAAAVAVFFASNPYFLIKFPDFFDNFVARFNWIMSAKNATAAHRDYLLPLTTLLNHSMGLPLLALSVLGIILAVTKRSGYDLILLSWVVTYYFLNAHSGIYYHIRYQTEQLPFLSLFAARFTMYIYGIRKRAGLLLLIFTGAATLALTIANTNVLRGEFPRTVASRWMTANIKDGSSLGTAQIPNENHPPVVFMQFYHAARYEQAPLERPLYAIFNLDFEPSNLLKLKPDYVVLRGEEYDAGYKNFPRGGEFMSLLNKDYTLERKFEIEPELFGIKFNNREYPAWIINYDSVLIFKKISG